MAIADLSNEREFMKIEEVISIGCYYICYQDPDYLFDCASSLCNAEASVTAV